MVNKTDPAPRIERCSFVSTIVAVPVVLALLSALQLAIHQPATEFLVLPPLAVITYAIFRDPFGRSSTLRSIVGLPCLGALAGELCSHYLGLTPEGVGAATFVVLIAQAIMRANMPPALALAVLALLLRAQGPTYVLGVLEGTLIIFALFRLWQRFILTAVAAPSPHLDATMLTMHWRL